MNTNKKSKMNKNLKKEPVAVILDYGTENEVRFPLDKFEEFSNKKRVDHPQETPPQVINNMGKRDQKTKRFNKKEEA